MGYIIRLIRRGSSRNIICKGGGVGRRSSRVLLQIWWARLNRVDALSYCTDFVCAIPHPRGSLPTPDINTMYSVHCTVYTVYNNCT